MILTPEEKELAVELIKIRINTYLMNHDNINSIGKGFFIDSVLKSVVIECATTAKAVLEQLNP